MIRLNKARRKKIADAIHTISSLCDDIDNVIVDEELSVSNMPENIRQGMENKVERFANSMEEAQGKLLEAQIILESVV